MASLNTLDMTKGSVVKKLLLFALPIFMSSLLQHFYTMADRIVVGRFATDGTLALPASAAAQRNTSGWISWPLPHRFGTASVLRWSQRC